MTFLAIDVGNSRLKWALYAAARPGAALLAHGVEFLDHIERLADGQWADLPAPTHMLGCVVAGDAVVGQHHVAIVAAADQQRFLFGQGPAGPRMQAGDDAHQPRAGDGF